MRFTAACCDLATGVILAPVAHRILHRFHMESAMNEESRFRRRLPFRRATAASTPCAAVVQSVIVVEPSPARQSLNDRIGGKSPRG